MWTDIAHGPTFERATNHSSLNRHESLMKTVMPLPSDIDRLLRFLPEFNDPGYEPIERWSDQWFGVPIYRPLVEQFFREASRDCWTNYAYKPQPAAALLENHDLIKRANLAQLRTLLTHCVRAERSCDGDWALLIENGDIFRLLFRLAELYAERDIAPSLDLSTVVF